ncbi:ABC transporter ATP-binding protein [Porphyromonas circumdentaria]|uniref:ABC transporter ATP-binding protein n=1 Tax=Porphyromonas circumdentaria TaxID=29524 RepID=UPI0026DD0678|nr:ABC transporter ATP-binding protein [Porphyromonas circumdentaria]MDO4721946.1 ABC transporter ATP-binding protein [Porphyromonas circumdentaria]
MIRKILNELTARGVRHLIISALFFVVYALCGTAIMLTVLFLIDRHISGESVSLISAAWILVGLLILKTISNAVADMSKHFAGFDLVERIREKIILKLKMFSLGFYTNERLGEISTVIHKDVDNMEMVVGHLWTRMSADFIVALILGIGLFWVDWHMGLAMIAILPIALFSLYRGIRSGTKAQQEAQDGLADMVSLFVEYVKGIPVLKIFGGKGMFRNRLDRSVSEFGESSKKTSRQAVASVGRYAFLIELAFALMATLGLWWIWSGELSLFAYLMFVIVSKEFYKPFVNMESHWLNYIKVKDSYERISRLLDAPVIVNPDQPKTAERFDLSFDGVGFHYEKEGFEMSDLTFNVPERTVTALVGSSGSGKTTITNLLLRFWEPQAGCIRIGGVDIREMDYDYLLGKISVVMQNVILFSDTIANNIKVGNRNATQGEIEEAARRAMIHDFIVSLPDGYETKIGENGLGLSGGQKQRLSIARAFLKDAPILLLDEITSNVDPINEYKIQQAMSALIRNRTVLVIAHHLQTIRNAHQIIVMEKGQLMEKGTHAELEAKGGMYCKLLSVQ